MTVYLVGAGPGDPGLITVKGLQLIKKANVILYDRLVNTSLLDHANGDCIKVSVGKRPGLHIMKQEEINELLVKYGSNNKTVVRLKGGDPFIFGRGGEEAEALSSNNIPFEVVPGITSAIAGPAYAGIPVTHRNYNSSVTFITGHTWDSKRIKDLCLPLKGTLVILMGASSFSAISEDLVSVGYDLSTPAVAINNATMNSQKTLKGTLLTLSKEQIPSPSVIVIGEICKLQSSLSWFEEKLSLVKGKKILLIRTSAQFEETKMILDSLDAEAISGGQYLIKELSWDKDSLKDANIIVVTSVNAIPLIEATIKDLSDKKFVAIGPSTKHAIENIGLTCQMPDNYTSEGLGTLIQGMALPEDKIVGLRSLKASQVLGNMLGNLKYEEVPIYDLEYEFGDIDAIKGADMVFFTSSYMVDNIYKYIEPHQIKVSIGPKTSSKMRERCIAPDVEATESTTEGMIRALLDYLRDSFL